MNKQPICDNPINGCMETGSGYRLCCNPEHSKETDPLLGPIWHPITDWPKPKYGIRLQTGPSQSMASDYRLAQAKVWHPITDWPKPKAQKGEPYADALKTGKQTESYN